MSIFLCKYKICSIFLLVTLCAIAPSAAQSVCEKLSNVTQSTPFSFQKHVMKLRGFSFHPHDKILLMFYDEFFLMVNKLEIQKNTENIGINTAYFGEIIGQPEWDFLKPYFLDTFSSDEEFDTMYFLSPKTISLLGGPLTFALSNKRSIAYDNSLFNWMFFHTTYIKLISTENVDRYMNVYAVGVDPVAKKGLIIYNFLYSAGNFFIYKFTYELIRNAADLESKSYFYLKLTSNPNEVRFVHPKKGNVTAAKLYPLAQQAMPGYIVSKKLLLFDVDLGCVHIIDNFEGFDLNEQFDQQIDFILVRRNIPYEKFFICEDKFDIPNKFSFLSPDRCDKTISNPDGQVYGGRNVGENDNTTDDNVIVWTGRNKESSNKTISSIIAILVVICSVVLCLFLIWRHNKKNKNSKNQSNSKAPSKKTKSVDKKSGAGGDLKVSSKSKIKIKQRSQQLSGGGVSSKKSAKSSKSSTSTPVTASSAGGVPAKSGSSSTGIGKQPSTKN